MLARSMAALVAAIHVLFPDPLQDAGARDKRGHDAESVIDLIENPVWDSPIDARCYA